MSLHPHAMYDIPCNKCCRCLGRACAGERYDEPGVLSVRFFNSCQHDAAAGSYGRLEGSRRAAVASMLQGRMQLQPNLLGSQQSVLQCSSATVLASS